MAKTPREGKKRPRDRFGLFLASPDKDKKEENDGAEKPKPPDLQPSLKTIALSDCSVCGSECSVVLTRSGHPFTACGKCGARTFYNSRVAIQILKRRMRELEDE